MSRTEQYMLIPLFICLSRVWHLTFLCQLRANANPRLLLGVSMSILTFMTSEMCPCIERLTWSTSLTVCYIDTSYIVATVILFNIVYLLCEVVYVDKGGIWREIENFNTKHIRDRRRLILWHDFLFCFNYLVVNRN